METTYSSLDVAELTGVSLRQLQWWDEQGLVSPQQSGHRRLYTSLEVLQVSLIMSLRTKGMSLQKIRPLLGKLSLKRVAEAVATNGVGGDAFLLTDGEAVHLHSSPGRIMEVLRDSERPITAVCITEMCRNLAIPDVAKKPVGTASTSTGRQRPEQPAAAAGSRR